MMMMMMKRLSDRTKTQIFWSSCNTVRKKTELLYQDFAMDKIFTMLQSLIADDRNDSKVIIYGLAMTWTYIIGDREPNT